MPQIFRWYSTVNAAMLYHLTNQIKETDNSGVWRYCIKHKKYLICFVSKLYFWNFKKFNKIKLILYKTCEGTYVIF